jgi:hypothetical protein
MQTITLKNTMFTFFLAIALATLSCGDSGKSPEPEPPDIDNGNGNNNGSAVDPKYLGSYDKNLQGLAKAIQTIGGSSFGSAFWDNVTWGRFADANLYVANEATLPQDYLNDNVVKDILSAKADDWEVRGTGKDGFKIYYPKNQMAFGVRRVNPDYNTWVWVLWEEASVPDGRRVPTLTLRISKADKSEFRGICAWYVPAR